MGPSVKLISAIKDAFWTKKNGVNFFPGEKIIPGAGGGVKDHTSIITTVPEIWQNTEIWTKLWQLWKWAKLVFGSNMEHWNYLSIVKILKFFNFGKNSKFRHNTKIWTKFWKSSEIWTRLMLGILWNIDEILKLWFLAKIWNLGKTLKFW